MKKFVCSVCDHVFSGVSLPDKCPLCHSPASKIQEIIINNSVNKDTCTLTVEVTNADYYDVIELFIDGKSFGMLQHNRKFHFEITNNSHYISAIYTNREADYAEYRHAISPVSFTGDANFNIEIINIHRGGNIIKV